MSRDSSPGRRERIETESRRNFLRRSLAAIVAAPALPALAEAAASAPAASAGSAAVAASDEDMREFLEEMARLVARYRLEAAGEGKVLTALGRSWCDLDAD